MVKNTALTRYALIVAPSACHPGVLKASDLTVKGHQRRPFLSLMKLYTAFLPELLLLLP
jgi:hypothetical protein